MNRRRAVAGVLSRRIVDPVIETVRPTVQPNEIAYWHFKSIDYAMAFPGMFGLSSWGVENKRRSEIHE